MVWREWLALGVLVVVGCGEREGERGHDAPEVLDRAMPLDDLDDIGEPLCAELGRMIEENPEFVDRFCMGEGIVWSQQGIPCEDIYESCVDEPLRRQATACEPTDQARDFGCPELTVGMYLDCMQQRQNEYAAHNQDLTCATPSDVVTGRALFGGIEEPTGACKKALNVCPNLFD